LSQGGQQLSQLSFVWSPEMRFRRYNVRQSQRGW
jgi:hypothetical protein